MTPNLLPLKKIGDPRERGLEPLKTCQRLHQRDGNEVEEDDYEEGNAHKEFAATQFHVRDRQVPPIHVAGLGGPLCDPNRGVHVLLRLGTHGGTPPWLKGNKCAWHHATWVLQQHLSFRLCLNKFLLLCQQFVLNKFLFQTIYGWQCSIALLNKSPPHIKGTPEQGRANKLKFVSDCPTLGFFSFIVLT